MRLLACGGRDYADRAFVAECLDKAHAKRPITLLIHGGAKGADALAEDWAQANLVPSKAYEAQWDVYGKAAGPVRNMRMLAEGKPDGVVAFPGGAGTAHMAGLAIDAGLPVWCPKRKG